MGTTENVKGGNEQIREVNGLFLLCKLITVFNEVLVQSNFFYTDTKGSGKRGHPLELFILQTQVEFIIMNVGPFHIR